MLVEDRSMKLLVEIWGLSVGDQILDWIPGLLLDSQQILYVK